MNESSPAAVSPPTTLLPENWTETLEALRAIGHMLWQRGWSAGTSSNYSVVLGRDPIQLIVTASGKDKGHLQRDDFVLVDGQGQPSFPGQPKSSAETMLHVVLAADPDVGAVLHTHSVWATLLSDYFFEQGHVLIEGYEMLKGLAGIATHETSQRMAIFENTQDIPALAENVRARLEDPTDPIRHGFLIRNHGLYTWGHDLAEARRHIEILEFLFEVLGRKLSLPIN
jgi:methylthioribulose-1-phosphate dehydratase